MIDNEEAVFALMQAAQDQMRAADRAVAAMRAQSRELGAALASLQGVQAAVADEAARGARQGVSAAVGPELRAEVDQATATLREASEEVQRSGRWLEWRWIAAFLVLGLVLGYAACWVMWGGDAHAASARLDAIEQTLQLQQQELAAVTARTHRHHARRAR